MALYDLVHIETGDVGTQHENRFIRRNQYSVRCSVPAQHGTGYAASVFGSVMPCGFLSAQMEKPWIGTAPEVEDRCPAVLACSVDQCGASAAPESAAVFALINHLKQSGVCLPDFVLVSPPSELGAETGYAEGLDVLEAEYTAKASAACGHAFAYHCGKRNLLFSGRSDGHGRGHRSHTHEAFDLTDGITDEQLGDIVCDTALANIDYGGSSESSDYHQGSISEGIQTHSHGIGNHIEAQSSRHGGAECDAHAFTPRHAGIAQCGCRDDNRVVRFVCGFVLDIGTREFSPEPCTECGARNIGIAEAFGNCPLVVGFLAQVQNQGLDCAFLAQSLSREQRVQILQPFLENSYIHLEPPLSSDAGENDIALNTQTFSQKRQEAQSFGLVRDGSASLSGLVMIPAGHIS